MFMNRHHFKRFGMIVMLIIATTEKTTQHISKFSVCGNLLVECFECRKIFAQREKQSLFRLRLFTRYSRCSRPISFAIQKIEWILSLWRIGSMPPDYPIYTYWTTSSRFHQFISQHLLYICFRINANEWRKKLSRQSFRFRFLNAINRQNKKSLQISNEYNCYIKEIM